jgi:hypothetical protein
MKAIALLLCFGGNLLAQSWVRTVSTDKMTGRTFVAYSLAATSSDGSARHRDPQISITCENNRFKFIDYYVDDILGSDHVDGDNAKSMIQYKVDDKRIRILWWNQTDDSQHAFSQSVRLKELLTAKSLMLRVETFTGDVLTDEFTVGGLDSPAFRADCGK